MASQSVKREDFVNPHAYNMRGDYVVVPPNSARYVGAPARLYSIAGLGGPDTLIHKLKRITSWQYLFCELKIFMWLILHSHPKTYAFI